MLSLIHIYVVWVEGVGGFRVPLDAQHDTADLTQCLALPVVLVVGMRLGCLNHATVSYTHLDVYKRQVYCCGGAAGRRALGRR